MTDLSRRIAELPARQRALLELRRGGDAGEPIAIVGIGCRFPGGVEGPASYWRFLLAGTDASREVPPQRWDADRYYDPDPRAPGKTYTRRGSFVDGVDRFDAAAFRISPREAASMDPQQRFVLETTWDAFEHAGMAPGGLAGSRSGVYLGMMSNDYPQLLIERGDLARADIYQGPGTEPSFLAGRVSYVFGLRGPSLVVSTACSSSLVALHLACQSLRAGESSLAIAGGVNLILSPTGTILTSRLQALSPDGRCKTFDASADGYGRGEGCAVVVLERLRDAAAAGRRIHALVRGSAVNHDGPKGGLTVPSAEAQREVIERALEAARVEGRDVAYLEAHGTGTPLGDPIELRAAWEVFGRGRPADRPLRVGSVKTNFGHLEAASGVAGLVKAALALRHGVVPPHLHLRTPNPHVPWDSMNVRVPAEPTPLPDEPRPRLAGVSSFGLSGMNAHVVLEEPPPRDPAPAPAGRPLVLSLSARSAEGLRDLVRAWRESIASESFALEDVCRTAARRTRHAFRADFPAADRESLLGAFDGHLDGRPVPILDPGPAGPVPEGEVLELPLARWERERFWFEEVRSPREDPSSSWFHEIRWEEEPGPAATGGERRRLVLAADHATAALARGTVVLEAAGGVERLVRALREAGPHHEIVDLRALGPLPAGAPREARCLAALDLVQAIPRTGWPDPPAVRLVTRGAVRAGDAGGVLDQAPLWGLGRTLALEHPELSPSLIDLDPDSTSLEALEAELRSEGPAAAIALRGGRRLVPRVVPLAVPEGTPAIRPEATYLITGGTGGLGLAVARWLAGEGAREVVLAARRDPTGEARAAIDALAASGMRVRVERADVSRRDEARSLVETAGPALAGVVHAAGALADRTLQALDPAAFRTVFAAKADGAWFLHEALGERRLDFFVLFGSAAAVLGSPGQANYAAANEWLGALAEIRRAAGLAALTIDWGPWAEVGMAAAAAREGRYAARGLGTIPPETGPRLMGRLLAAGPTRAAVVPLPPGAIPAAAPTRPRPDVLAGLRAAPVRERRELLEARVAEALGAVLRVPTDRIDRHAPLETFGLDSLTALELAGRIQAELGIALSPTTAWGHPTVAALAAHVAERLDLALVEETRAEPDALLEKVRALDDEEAARLLAERLDALEGS